MKSMKLYRSMTRLFYLMGVVMMLTGMMLSMVRVPVMAEEPPPAPEGGEPLLEEGSVLEDPLVTVEEPPPPEAPAVPEALGLGDLKAAGWEEEEAVVPLAQLDEKIDGDPSGILGAPFTFPNDPGTTIPGGFPFQFYKATGAPGQADGDCSFGSGVVTCFWTMPVTSAVNYSGDYGTIVIEDGTYVEGTISISKPIILQAGGPNVVLQSTDPILVEILNTHNVILIGLTIDGQKVPGVKGVVIVDSGDVTLFGNKIINNDIGVLVDGTGTGTVDLAKNQIYGNNVGVQIDSATDGAVRIMENVFGKSSTKEINTKNLVDNSGSDGFAIYNNEWGYLDGQGRYKTCTLSETDWNSGTFQTCARIFGTLTDAFNKSEFIRSGNFSRGAIWTTSGSCGTDKQDVNHFNQGDEVWINGSGFTPGHYVWSIEGKPGGASADPGLYVMGGIYEVDAGGNFCIKAYTVNRDDMGEYQVKFGTKGDNYRVKDTEEDGVSLSYKCSTDGKSIEWYVTNATNKSLRILWNVDNNSSYPNSKDVPKNSTVLLTTTGLGEHTVYLKWDAHFHPSVAMGSTKLAKPLMCEWHYLQLTSDKLACYQLKDIVIKHECTDDEQIEWVVENPNTFAIKVDWTLKDASSATIASGSGTDVGAGSELVLHTTGLGVYTLTVAVVHPFLSLYYNLASDIDTCYTPEPLVLSQACEYDQARKPTGRIVWTVTNPNDREFSFTLGGSAPPTPVAPLSPAPANGSTTFLSIDGSYNAFARFVHQSVNYDSNIVTTTAGDCEAPPLALVLSEACELVNDVKTGKIVWTVTNPNDKALSFYVVGVVPEEGAGPHAIGANGSATFTTDDNAVYAVTVTFTYKSVTYTSNEVVTVIEECEPPPDPLLLGNACEMKGDKKTGNIIWTVTNPNNKPLSFTVNGVTPNEGAGSFPIAALGSATFTSDDSAVYLVSVSFDYGIPTVTYTSETIQTTLEECASYGLSVGSCLIGGTTTFRLYAVNNGNTATQFRLDKYGSGYSIPLGTLGIGGSVGGYDNDSLITDQEGTYVKKVYDIGSGTWKNVSGTHVLSVAGHTQHGYICPNSPQELTIGYICRVGDNGISNGDIIQPASSGGEQIAWSINNPNAFDITFELIIDGVSDGTHTAPANSAYFFTTPTGAHTVAINWEVYGIPKSASEATQIDTCVPPQDLELLYECPPGSAGTIRWSVFNPNLVPIDFDYYLDQDPPVLPDGSGTVGAGETLEFALTSGGAHFVSIGWGQGKYEGLVSQETSPDYCLPPGGGGDDGGEPLPPPGTGEIGGAGGPVLIPVTGVDRSGMVERWLFNLGLVFLGAALMLTGAARRRKA